MPEVREAIALATMSTLNTYYNTSITLTGWKQGAQLLRIEWCWNVIPDAAGAHCEFAVSTGDYTSRTQISLPSSHVDYLAGSGLHFAASGNVTGGVVYNTAVFRPGEKELKSDKLTIEIVSASCSATKPQVGLKIVWANP